MQCKKVARLSGLSLLIASIVVPAGSAVNQNATTNGTTQMQLADGMPLPPLPLPPSQLDVIGQVA
jgi:hypothetical protein